MGRWSRIWLCCVSDGVPKRSLVVALIVGTILNLINQSDVLAAGARPNILKLILTFAVPYAVATYGAVSYRLRSGSERKNRRPALNGRAAIIAPELRLRGQTRAAPR